MDVVSAQAAKFIDLITDRPDALQVLHEPRSGRRRVRSSGIGGPGSRVGAVQRRASRRRPLDRQSTLDDGGGTALSSSKRQQQEHAHEEVKLQEEEEKDRTFEPPVSKEAEERGRIAMKKLRKQMLKLQDDKNRRRKLQKSASAFAERVNFRLRQKRDRQRLERLKTLTDAQKHSNNSSTVDASSSQAAAVAAVAAEAALAASTSKP